MKKHILILGSALALTGCSTTSQDFQEAQRINTTEAYKNFIQLHPGTEYASAAEAMMDAIAQCDAFKKALHENTKIIYEDFLTKYPSSNLAADVKHKLEELDCETDWAAAKATDSIESYEQFITAHPTSIGRAREARAAINKKQSEARAAINEMIEIRNRAANRAAMANSFRVVSAVKSFQQPIIKSELSYTANPLSGKMAMNEENGGMASPEEGSVFVVLNWDLSGFTGPTEFGLLKDSLCLIQPDGTKIHPVATAKWHTGNLLCWLPGATDGRDVTGEWLFVVPQKVIDQTEVQFCDRKVPLNAK
ncbi:MAG: lipoprotein [Verrucomicrobiota bacterium]